MNSISTAARATQTHQQEMESVFEEKYNKDLWPGGISDGTKSGFGSTMRSTELVREWLPTLFKDLGIKSLLDAPCGDFHWMRGTDISSIHYVGGDIANSVIAELEVTDANDNIEFTYFDIVESAFPSVDAWMCRDCLIHLPLELCLKALENFCRSNIDYALLTHLEDCDENKNIPIGRYSPRNMMAAPFNFPEPVQQVVDGPFTNTNPDRKLAVWTRDQIIKAIS